MDRSWINHMGMDDRKRPEYVMGVNQFLEYAFSGKDEGTKMRYHVLIVTYVCLFQIDAPFTIT